MANALFYLAVADRFFGPLIEQLGRAALTRQSEHAWRRVFVEKPFGHDLESARHALELARMAVQGAVGRLADNGAVEERQVVAYDVAHAAAAVECACHLLSEKPVETVSALRDITFACAHCASPLVVDAAAAGLTLPCQQCGRPTPIPDIPSAHARGAEADGLRRVWDALGAARHARVRGSC